MLYLLLLVLVVTTRAQHPPFQGLQFADNQLFEGDDCKIDGKSGTCLSLSACPIILSDKVVFTQQPPTCGYNDSVPIVCCPQKNDTEEYSKGCVSSVNNELYPTNSSTFYMCEELKCSQNSWIPTKEHDPDCELPFFAAVAKDEISKVKEFLKKGMSPNVKNKKGASIALKAIQNGHLEILSTLFENGADPQGPTALSHEESNLLLYAVAHESLEVIDILLGHGADINKHIYGSTPLRNAIKRKDIKIIKYLVDHKADVNEINIYQDKTVLMYSIATGNKDIVNLLIANGADVNGIAINGNTALQTAVILGNNEIVKLLLDNKAEINTRRHLSTGGTVLVEAIRRNHLDIAKTLLEHGADPNDATRQGETALIAASQKNNTSTLVDLLLEKGADINTTDIIGLPLMLLAIQNENKYLIEKLLHMGSPIDSLNYREKVPLIEAARGGSVTIVKTLLDNNADVGKFDGYGNTALEKASRYGFNDVVETLIHHGADVNMKIKFQPYNTALITAAGANYPNIVTTLLENGANPNITNERGNTAFYIAVTEGNVGVIKILIEYGADDMASLSGQPGSPNKTPILKYLIEGMACTDETKYLETMDLLLKNGAPIDAVNTDGETALIFVSSTERCISSSTRVEIAKFLLTHNATVNLTDINGYSALLWATKRGILNLVKLLVENDASVNQATKTGITPLILASIYGSQEMVEFLLQNNANTNNSGPSVSPNHYLSWLSVGSDRFVKFSQKLNWFDARALCQSHGLDLYQPTDILAVAKYLEDSFSDDFHWLGARGNGTHQVWISGGVLTRSDPLWYQNYYEKVDTNDCLAIITFPSMTGRTDQVLFASPDGCRHRSYDVICG